MEEIDIIELFRLVKEGKAPTMIEISGTTYYYKGFSDIAVMYQDNIWRDWLLEENIDLDTKIKIIDKEIEILDKPVIEEFYYDQSELNRFEVSVYHKIREIIKYLNKEDK